MIIIIIIIINHNHNDNDIDNDNDNNIDFQPIVVKSLGPANKSAIHFLTVLGKKLAQQTGDERETATAFMQRLNCVLLHDSLVHDNCPN